MSKYNARRAYLTAEIKRLSALGWSISKIAKHLNIEYKLALRLRDLGQDNQQERSNV